MSDDGEQPHAPCDPRHPNYPSGNLFALARAFFLCLIHSVTHRHNSAHPTRMHHHARQRRQTTPRPHQTTRDVHPTLNQSSTIPRRHQHHILFQTPRTHQQASPAHSARTARRTTAHNTAARRAIHNRRHAMPARTPERAPARRQQHQTTLLVLAEGQQTTAPHCTRTARHAKGTRGTKARRAPIGIHLIGGARSPRPHTKEGKRGVVIGRSLIGGALSPRTRTRAPLPHRHALPRRHTVNIPRATSQCPPPRRAPLRLHTPPQSHAALAASSTPLDRRAPAVNTTPRHIASAAASPRPTAAAVAHPRSAAQHRHAFCAAAPPRTGGSPRLVASPHRHTSQRTRTHTAASRAYRAPLDRRPCRVACAAAPLPPAALPPVAPYPNDCVRTLRTPCIIRSLSRHMYVRVVLL